MFLYKHLTVISGVRAYPASHWMVSVLFGVSGNPEVTCPLAITGFSSQLAAEIKGSISRFEAEFC